MDRCDYCGTDEQVTVYALDSEYYGKTVRLCPSCLRNKITTSFRPIDKLKLDDMIRSFLLVNDSPYSNAELKRDENCSFFLYPYLIGFELFEREVETPVFESWSREVYRRWVHFLTTVQRLENKRRKKGP